MTLCNLDRLRLNFIDYQPSSLQTNKKPVNEQNYHKIKSNIFCFAKKTQANKREKRQKETETKQKQFTKKQTNFVLPQWELLFYIIIFKLTIDR